MWESWKQSCFSCMFLWVIKPVITTQKLFIYKLRPQVAQSRTCFSFCNWCNCSFCAKLPARATADIFWKLTILFKQRSSRINFQQQKPQQNGVCWFRHFLLLSLDATRSPPPAQTAGAHQRHWKCKESLNAAPLKHSHGKWFAEHGHVWISLAPLKSRTGFLVIWIQIQVNHMFTQKSGFPET